MLTKQVMLTGVLTLAGALGIGVYMQASETRWGTGETGQPAAADTGTFAEPETESLLIEKISLTSAPSSPSSETIGLPRAEPVNEASCQTMAKAEAAPLAMVKLSVDAPCRPNERLTVHHSGMSFAVSLDDTGSYETFVPALTRTAVFIAETQSGSGSGAVAVAEVDGIEDFERVVVQWSGNSGLELHAREFGAAYGGEGHVWHGAEDHAGMGRIDRLGEQSLLVPRIAEIYSLPSSLPGQSGTVSLTAEAEVTGGNCGRDIFAQALQLTGGRLSSRDLVMGMPDCEAQGSFLVLNNLLEDLKIAAN
ncbi:hypothetical protein [Leisingera sp. JC1]|uniref:hypothetical protein n=1 Tax=Leisingera sp. JC1 TaxID=1855282 RepID=UPI0008034B76|nr:hypothetical protein [Leisingera sp. JC1]OBY26500.1 hypothetical protein A9D60_04445 [Leisingera sp. JC1]